MGRRMEGGDEDGRFANMVFCIGILAWLDTSGVLVFCIAWRSYCLVSLCLQKAFCIASVPQHSILLR